MRRRGQIQVEAVICLAFFLAFLSLALAGLGRQKEMLGNAAGIQLSENSAQACALAVNALYSNSAGKINSGFECISSDEHSVQGSSAGGERGKSAFTFARNVKIMQAHGKSILEVGADAHYK